MMDVLAKSFRAWFRWMAALALAVAVSGTAIQAESVSQGELVYGDGSKYSGGLANGVPHGQGYYVLPNGYEYRGSFVNGEINGFGEARFPDGSVYNGYFIAGVPDGFGKIIYPDGSSYDGAWSQGEMTGWGFATYTDGVTYDGEVLRGLRNGYGISKTPSGNTYEGEWQNGLATGFGVMRYADGSNYSGIFANDKRTGPGLTVVSGRGAAFGSWPDGDIPRSAISDAANVLPGLTQAFNGKTQEERRAIQDVLRQGGFYFGSTDGLWGYGTLSAVAGFAVLNIGTVEFNDPKIVARIYSRIDEAVRQAAQ